ncbi:MAG: hypothetical protein WBF33_14685 [Candidatus Nitrosopolaris sp.]
MKIPDRRTFDRRLSTISADIKERSSLIIPLSADFTQADVHGNHLHFQTKCDTRQVIWDMTTMNSINSAQIMDLTSTPCIRNIQSYFK